MIIASYNFENMFERPRVFSDDPSWRHDAVTDADDDEAVPATGAATMVIDEGQRATANQIVGLHARLNELFMKSEYSDYDKSQMAEIIGRLGLRFSDRNRFVELHRIRGNPLRRPRDRSKPVEIIASGRADWVGWLDLITEPVDEMATQHLAMTISESNADIVGVVEAENRIMLKIFADAFLRAADGTPYDQVMLIDGNDSRGIDVGMLVRKSDRYEIANIRTHMFETDGGQPFFSRDCLEVHINDRRSGEVVVFLMNHFKSKGYNDSDDPIGAKKRSRQAARVREIYDELVGEGLDKVVVLGDLNDSPTLPGKPESSLKPLFDSDLKDISEHDTFDTGERVGTFGTGHTLASKIDYILLSPPLFERVRAGGVNRKGVWHGPRVRNPWEMYPTLSKEQHAASDHALLWADLADTP